MRAPRVLLNALSVSEGGGRSYVTNLLREIDRDDRGFEFNVLARPGQLEAIAPASVEVRTVPLPGPARALWRVAYEEAVMPLVSRGFDLLFCPADLVPRFAPAPRVVLLRNLNIYDRRWYDNARTRTLERLVRWGLPGARRIVFPSQAAADLIAERIPVPPERVRIVHYGVSLEAFAPREGAEIPTARYLFVPAAVEKHKNLEVLVDALAHISDTELEVWIAGRSLLDPEHRARLERRARAAGVAERVRFLGAVSYSDVPRYYRQATAFVSPSFIETFGHPLLEAMAAGTPVVASDIPVSREIAGDAALYFPPEDPRALARAVDALQADSAATLRRVERGRERASRLTWEASIDGLCAVFDEVLREAGGPVPRTGSR